MPKLLVRSLAGASFACAVAACGPKPPPPTSPPAPPDASRETGTSVVLIPEAKAAGPAQSLLHPVASSAAAPDTGHPATERECKEIFNKIVELELKQQNVKDPAVIEQRKAQSETAMGDVTQGCVGQKLTDGALKCIRAASSVDQINDTCLR